MKFMELDEGGFIYHILDDPCITMLPVVNRFGNKGVSSRGHKLLGNNPAEHPVHLLPRALSDEHWNLLRAEGLAGRDIPEDASTAWHWRWDEDKQAPVKAYDKKSNTLPERTFGPNVVEAAGKKPCGNCPDKDAKDAKNA